MSASRLHADDLSSVRIAPGNANLILGCDIVVATSATALSRAERGVTRAVVNADLQPTASFVINPDIDFEMGAMRDALNGAITSDQLDVLDATGLATALMGDSIATNAFMLGFAFQRGAIPLSLAAIEKAIELNAAADRDESPGIRLGPSRCPRPATRRLCRALQGERHGACEEDAG